MLNQQKHTGFTLIELLIVIVVIAILAAISVVVYSGVQERARVAVKKSDVNTISKSFEVYRVNYGDGGHHEYPGYHTPQGYYGILAGLDQVSLPQSIRDKVAFTCAYSEGLHCTDRRGVSTDEYILGANGGTMYGVFYWDDMDAVWRQAIFGSVYPGEVYDYAYEWDQDEGFIPCTDQTFLECVGYVVEAEHS